MEKEPETNKSRMGRGIAIGIVIGIAIGVAIDNTSTGIAVGVAIGAESAQHGINCQGQRTDRATTQSPATSQFDFSPQPVRGLCAALGGP